MEQSYCAYYKLNKLQIVASVPFFRKWNRMERLVKMERMERMERLERMEHKTE